MFRTLLLIFVGISFLASAQLEKKTYYDPQKKKLQENYFVSKEDNSLMVGRYKRFYEDGTLMVDGNFDDGKKSGMFTEFHQNATPARRLNYVNGMRHGVAEIFNDEGQPIQKAYYQNDLLTDSIQLYFDNGIIKGETYFVKGKPEGLVKEYFSTGKIRREIHYKKGKPNGITRTYYEDGKVETEANYENGILKGFYKTYYTNGQLETVSTMEEGSKNGQYKNYDREGHLILEGSFLEGKLHGNNMAYFPDGKIQHKYAYLEGKKTGTNYEYHPNGKVKTREVASSNGVELKQENFDENEFLLSEKKFKNEKPDGTWTYYWEGSKTERQKEVYENGKLNGKRTYYFKNGKTAKEENLKFNILVGPFKTYYENGNPESQGEYRSNRKHGLYSAWHPNGKPKEQGEFIADKKHKEWKEFDEQGNLTRTLIFKAGILVQPRAEKIMQAIKETKFKFPGQTGFYSGKVRDVYYFGDYMAMVATDRISAFDVILPKAIPDKGRVLNQIAAFNLTATKSIVPNWVVSTPDPNVTVGFKCEPFPVEMVVRGYLAGHAAREYKAGKRKLCGVPLPEGLKENDKLPTPIITPTTKAKVGHDEDISREEILKRGLVSESDYKALEDYTLKLYKRGSELAAERNLILVDTKYEFGKHNGTIYLIDEVHTSDSSRYFYAEGYESRQQKGETQKQLSKEFVRQWLIENGFQGKEGQKVPEMTDPIVASISARYKELYEQVRGEALQPIDYTKIESRIEQSILKALGSLKSESLKNKDFEYILQVRTYTCVQLQNSNYYYMKYTIDKQEKYSLLRLHEEKLDSSVAPNLKSELITLHAEGVRNIILDLSEVKYTDSSGLSALLVGNRIVQEDGGIFVLTSLSEHTTKLIKISQLDSVLNILPKVEEAIDAVFMHEIEKDLKDSDGN